MSESSRIINQFNKYYPLFEKNVKSLIDQNSRLRLYIYIFICIIIVLVVYIVGSLLSKQNQYQE